MQVVYGILLIPVLSRTEHPYLVLVVVTLVINFLNMPLLFLINRTAKRLYELLIVMMLFDFMLLLVQLALYLVG